MDPESVPPQYPLPTVASAKEGISPPIPLLPLAVLSFLLLLSTAYLAYQYMQLQKQIAALQPSPISQITPIPIADPTVNWTTYTNTKYGYSFKYPSDYLVNQNGMGSKTPETVADIVAYNKTSQNPDDETRFSISITDKSLGTLLEQVQKHFDKISKYTIGQEYKDMVLKDQGYKALDNTVTESVTQITFSGLSAYEYIINGHTIEDGAAEYLGKQPAHKYIWLQNDDNIFLLHLDNVSLGNQILSTFKFTEQNDVLDNAPLLKYLTDQYTSQIEKYGKAEVKITINEASNANFAKGTAAISTGGGDIWFAAKVNSNWTLVEQTQEPPSCALMTQYNFPKSIYGDCIEK